MRKILVLRGGALGDFIVTLPALAALRRRWPAAQIEIVGNAYAAPLARTRGLVDVVHSQHEARWSALWSAAALPSDFATWLASFDLVLNYWPDADGDIERRFPLQPAQQFLSAPAMPTLAPAAAHYTAPLRHLGLATDDVFFPLADANAAADRRPPAPIAVHPGSGSTRKNWPAENWRALLAELPRPLRLIVGEAEAEAWQRFSAPGVSLLVSAPLEQLVAELSRCRLFLGHDSGISHLAAASGAPCVLLFGPTDPAVWAPPAPHVRVLQRGPDLRSITVADVLALVN